MGDQRQDALVSQQFDRYPRYWGQTGNPGTTYPGPRFKNNRGGYNRPEQNLLDREDKADHSDIHSQMPNTAQSHGRDTPGWQRKSRQWIWILRKKSIGGIRNGQVGTIHVPVESLAQALEDIRMRTGLQWPRDPEIVLTAVMRGTSGGHGRPAMGGHTHHGAGPLQKTVRMDLVNAGVDTGAHLSPNSQHLMENQRSGRVSSANFNREQNPVHGVGEKNCIL